MITFSNCKKYQHSLRSRIDELFVDPGFFGEEMKYIEIRTKDPHFNLAAEEYLLTNCKPNESYFLLWQNEPSIIIGKHQNTLEEINTGYVEENNIHVVRRMSGGGAVYHDLGNLNYSFIIGNGQQDLFDFKKFTYPIVEMLRQYGVKAEVSGRNDMTIEGRKFSGNAQFIRNSNLLHHGTLLFNSDLERLQDALKVSNDKIISKGIKSVRSRVTNILEHMEEKLGIDEFWEQLSSHIADQNEQWEQLKIGEADIAQISRLGDQKYRTWEWKYGASPCFNYRNFQRFDGGKLEVRLDIHDGMVTGCKFYGDFFSGEDFPKMEQELLGTRYQRNAIMEVLKRFRKEDLIMGISAEQILNTMFD